MKKEKISPIVIVTNILCGLLFVAMIAALFLPCWTYGEDITVSIGEYVGYPTEKAPMLKEFKTALSLDKTPEVNDVVTIPVVVLLVAVVGLLLCLLSRTVPVCALVAVGNGILGLVGYTVVPFFKLGASYTALLAVSGVTAAVGLIGTIAYIVLLVKKAKAAKLAA